MFKEFMPKVLYATITAYGDLCVVLAWELLTGGRGPEKLIQEEVQLLAKGEVKQKLNYSVSTLRRDIN